MASKFDEEVNLALALSLSETTTAHAATTPPRHTSTNTIIDLSTTPISTPAPLKVGDRVQIKPNHRPSNGFGPVEWNDVGIVKYIVAPLVAVDFGGKTTHLGEGGWTCSIDDLVKVPATTPTHSNSRATTSNSSSSSSSSSDNNTNTEGDLAMALKLQRVEEQVRQARSSAAQKYQESKSNSSSSSSSSSSSQNFNNNNNDHTSTTSFLRQDSTESVALHDRQILNEREADDVLNNIVATCIGNSSKFLDSDFPTTLASLHGEDAVRKGESKDGHQGAVGASRWQRAALTKKFDKTTRGVNPSSNWVVFRSDPSPEDLFQGGLGDCYFISALACVAQRPTLIKHLFVGLGYQDLYRTHSPHGVYQIRLCKDGYWTVVTIDSMLPVNASGCIAYASRC